MKRIEMIGASGVGKTTLYNKIIHVPIENRSYLTLKEAYKIAATNFDVSITNLKHWAYQMLLKIGILDSKSRGIGKTILHDLNDGVEQKYEYDPFIVSYTILLEYLKQEENRNAINQRINRFNKRIEEYLILKNYMPDHTPVLVDEGLVHCHPGITDYGIEKFSPNTLKQDLTFNPAGIIYCKQSVDAIFEQALGRKQKGILTFTHGPMSNDELRQYVEESVENHEKKVTYYKEHGVPVLDIDTREEFDVNTQKINAFISYIDN